MIPDTILSDGVNTIRTSPWRLACRVREQEVDPSDPDWRIVVVRDHELRSWNQ